jgi:tRNA(Ile)-lysidine synthase
MQKAKGKRQKAKGILHSASCTHLAGERRTTNDERRTMPRSLLARVERTVDRHGLLEKGDQVLVALSGGADSVFLLLVLKALSGPRGLKLYAFHLNHQLRGRASDADERFVRKFCSEQEVPCTVRRVNIRRRSRKQKQSLEEAGRETRYRLLLATARKLGCGKIATGHNAGDNVETIIMNLVRGAGLTGLAGIPVKRESDQVTKWPSGQVISPDHWATRSLGHCPSYSAIFIIRPLIAMQRREFEDWLKTRGIRYCRDSSNTQLEFRRNLVRHRVLPLMEKMNSTLVPVLSRSSEILRDEDEFMERQADGALKRITVIEGNGVKVDTRKLRRLHSAIQRRIIRRLVPGLDADGVDKLVELSRSPAPKHLSIRENRVAWKEASGLYIGPATTNNGFRVRSLNVPGRTRIPELGLELEIERRNWKLEIGNWKLPEAAKCKVLGTTNDEVRSTNVRTSDFGLRTSHVRRSEVFDLRDITMPLIARPRCKGDRMIPFGGSTKKLKEIMIDDRIPRRLRDRLPVLCDRQGILWVVGSRRADRARIRPDTKEVLMVRAVEFPNAECEMQKAVGADPRVCPVQAQRSAPAAFCIDPTGRQPSAVSRQPLTGLRRAAS